MKKILIIEDEEDVAEIIQKYLKNAGYEAAFTLNPEKGVEMMRDYDLLLLDLIMPKISGRAVLASLKEKKIKKPVIVLSAIQLTRTVGDELAKQYPGLRIVAKTSMHTELLKTIEEMLNGK